MTATARRGRPAVDIGATRTYPDGRIRVKTPTGWEWQHRLVMAAILGRDLLPHEPVAHINGQLGDNRPENLTLDGDRCPNCGTSLGNMPRAARMNRGSRAQRHKPRTDRPGQSRLWMGAP